MRHCKNLQLFFFIEIKDLFCVLPFGISHPKRITKQNNKQHTCIREVWLKLKYNIKEKQFGLFVKVKQGNKSRP